MSKQLVLYLATIAIVGALATTSEANQTVIHCSSPECAKSANIIYIDGMIQYFKDLYSAYYNTSLRGYIDKKFADVVKAVDEYLEKNLTPEIKEKCVYIMQTLHLNRNQMLQFNSSYLKRRAAVKIEDNTLKSVYQHVQHRLNEWESLKIDLNKCPINGSDMVNWKNSMECINKVQQRTELVKTATAAEYDAHQTYLSSSPNTDAKEEIDIIIEGMKVEYTSQFYYIFTQWSAAGFKC